MTTNEIKKVEFEPDVQSRTNKGQYYLVHAF